MNFKLIVGLGNPGKKYQFTRHNLGAECIKAYANKYGLSLNKEAKFQSLFASGTLVKEGESTVSSKAVVSLLIPETYMNRSGYAVRKAIDFFKISSAASSENKEVGERKAYFPDILIVVDDVYLKFGAMRLRPQGGAGGHNGLKDIESQLGSKEYPRLKLGIGPQSLSNGMLELDSPLEDYVLGRFTKDEEQEMPQFIQRAIAAIDSWLFEGVSASIQKIF